jgi:protein associated with RNAse G/E
MNIGDRVKVEAYKADGTCYRWWHATVEALEPGTIVLFAPAGHRVDDIAGAWQTSVAIRSYYWLDKWYSLLEAYTPGGQFEEVYVNINSPVEIEGAQIRFTDYQLDVSRRLPHKAQILDQDEFRAAAIEYGYSDELQQTCYEVAREAMVLADRWQPRGMPAEKT